MSCNLPPAQVQRLCTLCHYTWKAQLMYLPAQEMDIYLIGSLAKQKCWGAWKLQLEGLSHISEVTIPVNDIYFCCMKLGKDWFLGALLYLEIICIQMK